MAPQSPRKDVDAVWHILEERAKPLRGSFGGACPGARSRRPARTPRLSPRKHRNHLRLIEHMMVDGAPRKLAKAASLRKSFELLRSYPSLEDFLAFQFAIDLNYSELTDFSEMEFVVAGPGARDGIRKRFKDTAGLTEAEIIQVMAERAGDEFERLGMKFQSLWGRSLQLMDCQNVFCEVSKYARVAHPDVAGESGRTRIKAEVHASLCVDPSVVPPEVGSHSRRAHDDSLRPRALLHVLVEVRVVEEQLEQACPNRLRAQASWLMVVWAS